MQHRIVFKTLVKRLKEPKKFLQVLLGPRQVGKTTISLQLEKTLKIPCHYVSADLATLQDLSWVEVQWEIARQLIQKKGDQALLIIDEVQKIPNWSSMIKKLWDEDTKNKLSLKVVLLGSSPWLMQKGLSESLAGRFEILPVAHWEFSEMKEVFGWDLETFLFFGGYPGAAAIVDKKDVSRFVNYINDSLIETTLSRDILLMTQVNKPALLRRLFQLGCAYSSQILSYQKMLRQLQDAGNTTTLAHYLELLNGAGLIAGINKYANHKVRAKASSPKFCVYNTALLTAQLGTTFKQAKQDTEFLGRLTESAIGAYLLNSIRQTNIELFYWREQEKEVDFVLRKNDFVCAIEVKSSHKKESYSGLNAFKKAFNPDRILIIGKDGIDLEEFLTTPVEKWVS